MKLSAKLTIAGLILAVLAALGAGLAFPGDYPTEQQAQRTFTLPVDFTVVRKCLVRKDGAKQIITMGGDSEFVSQQWSEIGAEVNPKEILNADWRLQLHGTLTVKTLDDYIGEQVVDLAQDVDITIDKLDSQVKLEKGAERLADYAMQTVFTRSGDEDTTVELSLRQKIITEAPWWAHGIADRRVKASVEKTLANQEAAIRKFIEDNKDDVPLLPLR
ncbi:MAG: hypothetical protein CMJ58_26620 [Planctomycetaceae bacterium]|nr:hypothetical protein [Planctomycetaceae bacterium]